jgi:Ca-activated chloride channel family protein
MAAMHRAAAMAALPLVTLCIFNVRAFQSANTSPVAVQITPRSHAEGRAEASVPEPYLRADASMVLVPAEVTTRSGSPVLGLRKEDFRIYEDGTEQNISYLIRDNAPISVGLLFDSSASMKEKKQRPAEAAAALFRTANADDEFFLIAFDEQPRLKVPFTTDTSELYREIKRVRPFGRTSLFDAIHLALGLMKNARHERRALVILSDGGDNRSRRTFNGIKNDVLESDVQIYAMGIFDPQGASNSPEEAGGPELLSRLAELTGGREFLANLADLPTISATIGELLHNQYLLGYSPMNTARDGTYRSITVELATPRGNPVSVRYRKGYHAPGR